MQKEIIKDEEMSPSKVADFFLSKSTMTQKKLQKLVYYAYAWFIALNNEDKDNISIKLFEERPEAWMHGPVFPSLYVAYKQNGWHNIPKLDKDVVCENSDVQDFLEKIWEKFGDYSADQLEAMTHSEAPWKNAREGVGVAESSNNKISDKDIFVFYNELAEKK